MKTYVVLLACALLVAGMKRAFPKPFADQKKIKTRFVPLVAGFMDFGEIFAMNMPLDGLAAFGSISKICKDLMITALNVRYQDVDDTLSEMKQHPFSSSEYQLLKVHLEKLWPKSDNPVIQLRLEDSMKRILDSWANSDAVSEIMYPMFKSPYRDMNQIIIKFSETPILEPSYDLLTYPEMDFEKFKGRYWMLFSESLDELVFEMIRRRRYDLLDLIGTDLQECIEQKAERDEFQAILNARSIDQAAGHPETMNCYLINALWLSLSGPKANYQWVGEAAKKDIASMRPLFHDLFLSQVELFQALQIIMKTKLMMLCEVVLLAWKIRPETTKSEMCEAAQACLLSSTKTNLSQLAMGEGLDMPLDEEALHQLLVLSILSEEILTEAIQKAFSKTGLKLPGLQFGILAISCGSNAGVVQWLMDMIDVNSVCFIPYEFPENIELPLSFASKLSSIPAIRTLYSDHGAVVAELLDSDSTFYRDHMHLLEDDFRSLNEACVFPVLMARHNLDWLSRLNFIVSGEARRLLFTYLSSHDPKLLHSVVKAKLRSTGKYKSKRANGAVNDMNLSLWVAALGSTYQGLKTLNTLCDEFPELNPIDMILTCEDDLEDTEELINVLYDQKYMEPEQMMAFIYECFALQSLHELTYSAEWTDDQKFFLDKYLLHFVRDQTTLEDFLPYAYLPLSLSDPLPIQKALIKVYGIDCFAELEAMTVRNHKTL